MKSGLKQEVVKYLFIVAGSLFYGIGTSIFIYPHSLLLGGTTGISVILNTFLPFPPEDILSVLNYALLLLALFILGKAAFARNVAGAVLTTISISSIAKIFTGRDPVADSPLISVIIGASFVALASALMFYVGASSGGTDIIALIVRKYIPIHVGRALLLTDFLIVVLGGILSGPVIGLCSFLGLIIKTTGIDLIIGLINRHREKRMETE